METKKGNLFSGFFLVNLVVVLIISGAWYVSRRSAPPEALRNLGDLMFSFALLTFLYLPVKNFFEQRVKKVRNFSRFIRLVRMRNCDEVYAEVQEAKLYKCNIRFSAKKEGVVCIVCDAVVENIYVISGIRGEELSPIEKCLECSDNKLAELKRAIPGIKVFVQKGMHTFSKEEVAARLRKVGYSM